VLETLLCYTRCCRCQCLCSRSALYVRVRQLCGACVHQVPKYLRSRLQPLANCTAPASTAAVSSLTYAYTPPSDICLHPPPSATCLPRPKSIQNSPKYLRSRLQPLAAALSQHPPLL
jgi:hypothetical protein